MSVANGGGISANHESKGRVDGSSMSDALAQGAKRKAERIRAAAENRDLPRLKSDEQMTVSDWTRYRQTGERPLNPEYVKARDAVLEVAGLEPEASGSEKALEDMTVEDHARRRYGDGA
jgi:hypothetical protein